MQLIQENITQTLNEHYLVETFNLDNKVILELGCGNAAMTKKIAHTGVNRKIIACETDDVQHEKNLKLDIDNIDFKPYKAEDIPLENESIDMVFMFKSFHHIQKELMPQALLEIKRVLKPNGLIYICEPLFAGKQNELIAMFHDEQQVRIDAFEVIKSAVETQEFKLFKELFFQTEVSYNNFEDFKEKHINLSYNDDTYDEKIETKIETKYNSFANEEGLTQFLKPFRVDILQKVSMV